MYDAVTQCEGFRIPFQTDSHSTCAGTWFHSTSHLGCKQTHVGLSHVMRLQNLMVLFLDYLCLLEMIVCIWIGYLDLCEATF
ncbi:hypothetical protein IQ07DRAFT_591859 [Pyrenochaeta sp. DS3sAY3a]|nr:hypothetical protein IQ07DRAFT_591859 [Pyrenochaeta sp. DS3sAY3a]